MSQLSSRRSSPIWIAALAAVLALVTILITHRISTEIATAEPPAGGTLPVGAGLPSGQYCAGYASQVGSAHEARPENTQANQSVPTDLGLPPWPSFWAPAANSQFVPRIDGQYTGTTDQIIAWGACKWRIDTDVVRAMAVQESAWRQAKVGDYVDDPAECVDGYSVPCPTSFGLLQLKHTTRPGSWPNSQLHTAFNVDYSLAVLRGCFEGWVSYLHNGYTAGDLWGCLGWHFSGEWKDSSGQAYVSRVQRALDVKPWTRW